MVEPGWFISQLGRLLSCTRIESHFKGISARAMREVRSCGMLLPEVIEAAWATEDAATKQWLLSAMKSCHLIVEIDGNLRVPMLLPLLTKGDGEDARWQPPARESLVVTFADRVWPVASADEPFGLPIADLVFPVLLARLSAIPAIQALEVYRDAFVLDHAQLGSVLYARVLSAETVVAWVDEPASGCTDKAAKLLALLADGVWSILRERLSSAPCTLGPACASRPLHAQPLAEVCSNSGRFTTCICQRRLPKSGNPGWVSAWPSTTAQASDISGSDLAGVWHVGQEAARGGWQSLEEYRMRARIGAIDERPKSVTSFSRPASRQSDRLSGSSDGEHARVSKSKSSSAMPRRKQKLKETEKSPDEESDPIKPINDHLDNMQAHAAKIGVSVGSKTSKHAVAQQSSRIPRSSVPSQVAQRQPPSKLAPPSHRKKGI